MLIKKRLAISNILMIAIPTIVALLIVFVSLAAIWIPSVQRNNIGVRDLEDFERTGTFMLTQVEGKLQETAAAGREPKISDGCISRITPSYGIYGARGRVYR